MKLINPYLYFDGQRKLIKVVSTLIILSFSVTVTFAQIKECDIRWIKNGQSQYFSYVNAGQTYTIERDPGTAVSFSVWPTASAPSPRTYYLVDWGNSIFNNSGSTTQGYWYFDNKVGSAATEVWLYITSQDDGLIKIAINNYVPPLPDLTVTNITFNGSVLPESYQSGQSVNISCRVDNNGSGTAASSYLGMYLGNSSSDFSNRIASKSTGTLPGLTSKYVDYTYTFQDADVGTKYFLFKADRTDVVTESYENNNTAYKGSFNVSGAPLIIDVTQPSTDITITQGQLVTVTWTGGGTGAASVNLRRDNDKVWENGTGEVWITLTQPVSGSYLWDTKDVPPGNYYIAVALYSTSTYTYDYAFGKVTINPLTGNLKISVKNIDGTGTPLPGNEGRIKLFNSSGIQIGTEKSTDDLGEVTFSDIPAGSGYYYEVYHDPINPPTPFGREYWGKRTDLNITSNGVTESFTRNQPYGGEIRVFNGVTDVTGQTVQTGIPLTIKYRIYNPENVDKYAKGNVLLDRDNTYPYDLPVWGSERILIPANDFLVQEMSFTPQYAGIYYAAGGVDISTTGDALYTDGGKWGTQPIINVINSTSEISLLAALTNLANLRGNSFGNLANQYANNLKNLAFISFGTIEIFFDLDDYYSAMNPDQSITQEGKDGWITIWVNGKLGLGAKILPFGVGIAPPLSFSPPENDPKKSWELTLLSANLPFLYTSVIEYNNGGFDWGIIETIPQTSIGFEIIELDFNVIRFEIRKEALDQMFIATFLPQGSTNGILNFEEIIQAGGNLIQSLIDFSGEQVIPNPLLSSSSYRRFSSSDTDQTGVDGVINFLNGGIDIDGDGTRDNYYPVMPITLFGLPFGGYQAELTFQNTGFETADFYIKAKNISDGWYVGADDGGWSPLVDNRFDFSNVDPNPWNNSVRTSNWAIACLSDSPAEATITFELWHKRSLIESDVLLQDKTVTLHKFTDASNIRPSIQLLNPSNNISLNQFSNFDIIWDDQDPDDNAELSIAIDPDINNLPWEGIQNHIWIAKGIKEDPDGEGDVFTWGINGIQPGLYKLWLVIYDGKNLPYYKCSDFTITIETQNDFAVPLVIINTSNSLWFKSNPTFNIDFSDNIALDDVNYQIDSNDDSNPSNWHVLTSDGINILPGSQNNSGTSLTGNWKISDEDWNNLTINSQNIGKHYLYFKVTDDAGNTYITPDQASAFEFRKDNIPPNISINLPAEGQSFTVNSIEATWYADDLIAGLQLSGLNAIYIALDQSTDFIELNESSRSYSFSNLQNGNHIIYLKASDNAGNFSSVKQVSFAVTVPVIDKILAVIPDASWSYGDVSLNNLVDKAFILQNTGTSVFSVSNVTISGTEADQFSIISPVNTSFDLTAGASQSLRVRFNPTTPGEKASVLNIYNNSDNASPVKTIDLTGNGFISPPRTIVVALSGSDESGDGTEFNPYRTIQHAVDLASANDIVYVHSGSYYENITMKSNIYVKGENNQNTSIIGQALVAGIVNFSDAINCTLDGFRISVSTKVPGIDRAVVFLQNDNTSTLKNCIIYGTQYGIFIWNQSTSNIFNNTLAGISGEQGIQFQERSGAAIINNIISGYSWGIHIASGGSGVPEIKYNNLWNNTINYSNIEDQSGINGNISLNPQFTQESNLDFTLKCNSPCINSGDPSFPLDNQNSLQEIGACTYLPVPPTMPSVQTLGVAKVTKSSVEVNSDITSDGCSSITGRGVCWSTNPGPTADLLTKTGDGTGTGIFISNVNNLTPGTIYYIRAFAINSAGTAYGEEISIKTYNPDAVNDIDGNYYNIVTIGTQVWLQENLRTTGLNDNTLITEITGGSEWAGTSSAAYCWYNNDISYKNVYGALYNWYTVNTGKICPVGWHVPSNSEWTVLETYLGGYSVAGGKMKEPGYVHWSSWNTGATNESGFTGRGSGYRAPQFIDLGRGTNFWSSDTYSDTQAWWRGLPDYQTVLTNGFHLKTYGFSIRCIKDIIAPSLLTGQIISITQTSAQSGGNIISEGESLVTARGVCWSTNPNPTVDLPTKTSDGSGIGTYSSNLTGLTPGTKYYLRTYATNSLGGTTYGTEISFKTYNSDAIQDVEGNYYNIVTIGSQKWIAENLRTTRYNDGTYIPLVSDNLTWSNLSTPAFCWIENKPASYKDLYGGAYNWYAVNTGKLCPLGWHVPSDGEWMDLIDYLGGRNIAGGKLKSTGTLEGGDGLWNSPNTGATNETGFSAVPAGGRVADVGYEGIFLTPGASSYFWSNFEASFTTATYFNLWYGSTFVEWPSHDKKRGWSVRCIKDLAQTSIAFNKPATSQSDYSSSYMASKGNDEDGSNSSMWAAAPYPQWWKVDLEGVYDVTGIVVRNYVDGVRYYHYTVEGSIDGQTYTQIAEKTNDNPATDAGDSYSVTATARYLRVNLTYNSDNEGVHLCDFRAYGALHAGYIISSSSSAGGSISPLGNIEVASGANQAFTITPAFGYQVADVLVDGSSVGAVQAYEFQNVTASHTIYATFSAMDNIALNKPATSKSDYSSSYMASKGNDEDGSNNSMWAAAPYQQWWKVDLGGVYDVTGIVVRNYVDGARYYHYSVEGSTDDQTYTLIASKTDDNAATDAGDSYSVTTTARFLRVSLTYNSDNEGVHLCDFRAYGSLHAGNIISSSSSAGGTISPLGTVNVASGSNQAFTITPAFGYQIEDVLVDGLSVGAVQSYEFQNVTASHTIYATFSAMTNIALNKPATSKSDYSSSYMASKGNDEDGSNNSMWAAAPYPQWWKVDLGGVYNVTGIVIRNYVDGVRYYHYTVERSTDDQTYSQITSKTDNNAATDAGDSYSVTTTARFLRVTLTNNSDNPGVHLCDFRAYGTLNAYIISSSAGVGGTISPSGSVEVASGADQSFTITPAFGYQVEDVLVDGSSVGAVQSYEFQNVTASHTIYATFSAMTNIALNKPATSQSDYSLSYVASNGNDDDGSNNSMWAGVPYPQWWKVDLGDVYNITGIVVRNYVDGSRYYHYTIETSTDDQTYTQIASKTNDNAATDEGDGYPVTVAAQYLRVNITYNSNNAGVHITDFRVFGTLQGAGKGSSPDAQPPNKDKISESSQREFKVNIYPNPFSDQFTIRIDSPNEEMFDISIINLQGGKVYSRTEIPANTENTLDPELSKGIYILIVNNKERRVIYRIVKY
jgi:uncharacterized protein (TIGR02145 family)